MRVDDRRDTCRDASGWACRRQRKQLEQRDPEALPRRVLILQDRRLSQRASSISRETWTVEVAVGHLASQNGQCT